MSASTIAIPTPQSNFGYVSRIFQKEIRYEFVRMLRTRAFSLSVFGFPVMFYLLFGVSNRHTDFARYLMASYGCMGCGLGLPLRHRDGNRHGACPGMA